MCVCVCVCDMMYVATSLFITWLSLLIFRSSGLVETESEEAAFNYLVVYHEIKINDMFLVLTTVKHDWEG